MNMIIRASRINTSDVSYYEQLAAARFRQYKWARRKAELGNSAIAIILQLMQHAGPLLLQTGIAKRRNIEKVRVE